MPSVPNKTSPVPGKDKGQPKSALATSLQRKASDSRKATEEATKPEGTTIYTAREIMAMELPEPKSIVHGVITEGVNMLVSRPKLGKSWMSLQAGIAVAGGHPAFGSLPTTPGDVLYLALEDNHRRLKKRLAKVLAGKPAPERLELVTEWPRMDSGGIEQLETWVKGVRNARLAIIDTFAKLRSLKVGQADRYAEDYHAVGQVKKFADDNHVAVLLVHHDRKAGSEDALDDVSGSIGITGAADTILLLRRERGQLDACLYVTGRDIDEQELALDWEQDTCRWIKSDGEARELRMSEARRAVLECVKQYGPITPKETAARLGKKENNVKQLLHSMAKNNEVKSKDGHYTVITG